MNSGSDQNKTKPNKLKLNILTIKEYLITLIWVVVAGGITFAVINYILSETDFAVQTNASTDKMSDDTRKRLFNVSLRDSTNVSSIDYTAYRVYFNKVYHQPICVCYELLANRSQRNLPYSKQYKTDINIQQSAQSSDYTNSGFDRGHLVPAADMRWDDKAINETYYMSNICPMRPELNRGLWLLLENKVRAWVERDQNLTIITGPIFRPITPADTIQRIGTTGVAVPTAFFKILLASTIKHPRAIGFIIPNQDGLHGDLSEYAVSVDDIERQTGYDFFSILPDSIEERLQKQCNFNAWNAL